MIEIEIEDILKDLLQSDIVFRVNNKNWRKGKLILYKLHDFVIQFILKNNVKIVKLDIPIPFNIKRMNKSKIVFDYKLNTLGIKPYQVDGLINKNKNIHILYDNILEIEII